MDFYAQHSQKDGITAKVGGGQAHATILEHTFNLIDNCSNVNDSCKTDEATEGKIREVINNGLEDLELFPAIGERFSNGTGLMAVDESIILSSGNGQKFRCFTAGVFRFN